MNILIVANHYAVCSARYAADAFTRLGHTVKHVGQPMGRNIWGMQVPEEYVWTPDEEEHTVAHDLVVVMDSDPAVLDYAKRWQTVTPHIIVWGVDNHVRDYRRPYFDHYFLAHRSVSVMDWERDIEESAGYAIFTDIVDSPDMTWLPCAYDPVAFPPSPIPWSERAYDVCCLGVLYPQRHALIAAMKKAGLKVLAGTGLVYDAYRDAYHNSRVALVSSSNGDLPIRFFEGIGMGCVVLHDAGIEDIYLLDEHGTHTWDFGGNQEMANAEVISHVRLLNERPDDALEAIEWGVKWASRHTFDARAEVIVSWYNNEYK